MSSSALECKPGGFTDFVPSGAHGIGDLTAAAATAMASFGWGQSPRGGLAGGISIGPPATPPTGPPFAPPEAATAETAINEPFCACAE
mmetsp:Transcript_14985/g.45231  ORF Transcript_14985/g.45231 Transcript_14985/m.45231 type:complete len:88 (-) Transcript_14985:1665-1928(-)